MEIKELLELNAEGWIPGPKETESAFQARVAAGKKLFQEQLSPLPSYEWLWPTEQLDALFKFSPRWCPVFCSSKKLAPWQAAVTWVTQEKNISIQLNPSRWIARCIDRRELLAHEAAHAARAAFDEPCYEEFFAYLTSSKHWRRVLGPFFRTPKEPLILVSLLILGMFSPLFFFPSFLLILIGGLRLYRLRLLLLRASTNLLPLLRNPNDLRPLLFRLTDQEIFSLAKRGSLQDQEELRWDLIKAAYLRNDWDKV